MKVMPKHHIHILLLYLEKYFFCLENMIRGLDGDETVFLDLVAKQQEEIANRRFDEESQEIREYRVYIMVIVSIYLFFCGLSLCI